MWVQLYATTHTKDDLAAGVRKGTLANIGMQRWNTELSVLAQTSGLINRRATKRQISVADIRALAPNAPVASPIDVCADTAQNLSAAAELAAAFEG
jgi:hypothetical protein